MTVTLDRLRREYQVAETDHQLWLAGDARGEPVEEVREAPVRPDDEHSGDAEFVSPMPGTVVAVKSPTGRRWRWAPWWWPSRP